MTYKRVPWHKINKLEIVHRPTSVLSGASTGLIFYYKQENKRSWMRFSSPMIKVLKYRGVSNEEILELASQYCKKLSIVERPAK